MRVALYLRSSYVQYHFYIPVTRCIRLLIICLSLYITIGYVISSRLLLYRVLREEWEKREELERLQEEQRVLLEQEREKRKEFEQKQREKELQLIGL